jgi:hypothetical protein
MLPQMDFTDTVPSSKITQPGGMSVYSTGTERFDGFEPVYLLHDWDSSAGIATGYGPDDRMIALRFSAGAKNFSLLHCVQTGSGAHPASYLMGTRILPLDIKRPGRAADHSPPSSTEVKE